MYRSTQTATEFASITAQPTAAWPPRTSQSRRSSSSSHLAEAVGAADPPIAGRRAARAEIDAAIGTWTATRERDHIVALLRRAGLRAAPVLSISELFTDPQLATFNGVGQGGLFYTGSFKQLGAQGAAVGAAFITVFTLSYGLFWAIKKTVGLRVSERHEIDGLDISEHGMWGYPEQFMPVPGGAYIHPDAVAEPARQLIGALVSPEHAAAPEHSPAMEHSSTPEGVTP
jgi:Amt family ammonium transporter